MMNRPIEIGPETIWDLSIEYQLQSYTAAGFAGLCIAEWNKFLHKKKLLK